MPLIRDPAIVPPSPVEPSQQPAQARDEARGLMERGDITRTRLQARHSRPQRPDRVARWLGLAVALTLHVGFMIVVWQQMQPPLLVADETSSAEDVVMRVRFLDGPPPSAPAPPEVPPPESLPRPTRAVVKPVPPAANAMVIQDHSAPASSASTARLFDASGSVVLPSQQAGAPVPDYVQRAPQGDSQIMRHGSAVKYQATRFDKSWSEGSNAVDDVLQKAVDKTTVKKTIRLPGGVRVHCAVTLLFGGCSGDPPAPPSAKIGDARLSMAPAAPLAADPNAPPPPSVDACIEMYRAGKPLEWGCPVDTPSRSAERDMEEQAAKDKRG